MIESALCGLRIGSVPYLNAKPLLWGIEEGIDFAVPSTLSDAFNAGKLDVALLPVFEALQVPGAQIVEGYAIGAIGPVTSVILVSHEPVSEIQEIALDPASRTSVSLLRILLRGKFHTQPSLVLREAQADDARLIIGDPALAFREGSTEGWHIMDLAEEWVRWTELPFVFAAWTLRPGLPQAKDIAEALRAVARRGLAARSEIASSQPHPEASLRYLEHAIHYSFGDREKAGLACYQEYLGAYGLIPADRTPVCFV